MKRITSVACALVAALGLFGCSGGAATPPAETPAPAASEGSVQKYGALGRLAKLNMTAEQLNEIIKDTIDNDVMTEFVFYDTLNSMVMALNNGEIAMLQIDLNTANYIAAHNENVVVRMPYQQPATTPFSMLLRSEDSELRDRISAAIKEMKADGTLDEIKKAYIDDVIAGTEPEAVVPEVFEGAETIKFAVTGDRPPMDYTAASGEASGFNTRLSAEIGRRLKMNVEFVSVDSAARGMSLASGASDVVFWMEKANYDNYDGSTDEEDQPANTIATESYLESYNVYVVPKSSPLATFLDEVDPAQ